MEYREIDKSKAYELLATSFKEYEGEPKPQLFVGKEKHLVNITKPLTLNVGTRMIQDPLTAIWWFQGETFYVIK